MSFKWFSLTEIPYSLMWDDDKYWLPYIINGKKLRASFIFKNENNENVVAEKEIKEIINFEETL